MVSGAEFCLEGSATLVAVRVSFKVSGTKGLELAIGNARDENSSLGNVPKSLRTFRIDIRESGSNTHAMSKPEAVRRIKSHSAANGNVCQYYFYDLNRVLVEGR